MRYLLILAMLLAGCSGGSSDNTEPEQTPNNIYDDIQDFAVSEYLYTLSHIGSRATIKRYTRDAEYLGESLDTVEIGHQGLSIDRYGFFWSTAPDYRSAVKFIYADDAKPLVVGIYTLFDDSYNNSNSTPAIGKGYLVAHARKDSKSTIRVWLLDDLQESGDYSDKFIYEWQPSIVKKDHPLQGIATDGVKVWMISGFAQIEAKPLHTYSMQGELIKSEMFSKGLDLAETEGTRYEPEGLSYYNGLHVGIVSGVNGARISRIYSTSSAVKL